MNGNQADVAIAGAGIIGLSVALELAAAGRRVVVFERGLAMQEASWAAAGMLAAHDPENPAALTALSQFSIGLYPEFLARVEQMSGRNIPIRSTQTMQGAHALPAGAKELSAEQIEAIAPGLRAGELKFFLLNEGSLDPRDLARALPQAVLASGITLLEDTAVTAVSAAPGALRIDTSRGPWLANDFVNACGAWAAELADLPIRPRKGQMLLVESPEPLAVTLRTPHLYLVPRGDGRVVIGATVEDAGFDKQVHSATLAALHSAAAELWPPIRNARVLDTWAGLRPASPDDLPVIGLEAGPSGERRWAALGHFRNGIMLAPGTARLLRQLICGETAGIDAEAYGAARFAASIAR